MAREIKFIAAIDDRYGLSKEGRLPWDLPSDREFFRKTISSGIGLMGWNTFVSNHKKPFPTSPRNVVIANRSEQYDGVEMIGDLQGFIDSTTEDICVIGGGYVFRQLLPQATRLYITRVSGDFDCDVFFPEFESSFKLDERSREKEENGTKYHFEVWVPREALQ